MRISDWSSDVCSSDLPACSEQNGLFRPALITGGSKRAGSGSAYTVSLRIPSHTRQRAFQGREENMESGSHQSEPTGSSSLRSEERRVGKECGSTCRYWRSPFH